MRNHPTIARCRVRIALWRPIDDGAYHPPSRHKGLSAVKTQIVFDAHAIEDVQVAAELGCKCNDGDLQGRAPVGCHAGEMPAR